jgi:hypothetical protein
MRKLLDDVAWTIIAMCVLILIGHLIEGSM